jgi:hypothetical protein
MNAPTMEPLQGGGQNRPAPAAAADSDTHDETTEEAATKARTYGAEPVSFDVHSQSSAADSGESPLRSAISVLTTLGPPLTIVTALMIYFGWARSDAQAQFMGVEVRLFGFSAQDYVLQSISTLYLPLLVIAVLALGGLAMHQRVDQALRRPSVRPVLRTAGRVAFVIGFVAVGVAVFIAWRDPTRASLVIPLVLAFGTAFAAYGSWLAGAARKLDTAVPALPSWQRALRTLLVGSVITLALFWEVSVYAGIVGRGYAQDLAESLPKLPRATAFSVSPLGIDAPGVDEERIELNPETGTEAAARYRTTGLRFLASSGGRIFLLHDGWRPGDGTVIVLPDNEQIVWQFSR